MRLHTSLLTAGCSLLLSVAHASAQSVDTAAPAPPASSWAPSISRSLSFDDQRGPYGRRGGGSRDSGPRVFGGIEIESMRAKQSFTDTLGSSTIIGFGGGIDVGGSLFFRVGVSSLSKSGTRFVGADTNGPALDVSMVPIDLGVGYRMDNLTPSHTVVPYVGGGALFLHYKETTPSGAAADNTNIWKVGYQVFAGVDLRLLPLISVAPEFEFRGVPKALGTAGLSQLFGETDLGGLTFRIDVAFHLGRH